MKKHIIKNNPLFNNISPIIDKSKYLLNNEGLWNVFLNFRSPEAMFEYTSSKKIAFSSINLL